MMGKEPGKKKKSKSSDSNEKQGSSGFSSPNSFDKDTAGKKKKTKASDLNEKQVSSGANSPNAYDRDTAVFVGMSQELKEEGNKLFQRRDYEGAMLKYEKALNLLPRNHIDVSYIRSNMAACYMQMGFNEYPKAIHECNLALEVTPKYSKALMKRARCYEALNRLDLALRDVNSVLQMEPKNLMAMEVAERVSMTIERKGVRENDEVFDVFPDFVDLSSASSSPKISKVKHRKKRSKKVKDRRANETIVEEKSDDELEKESEDEVEKKPEDKVEKKTEEKLEKKPEDEVEKKPEEKLEKKPEKKVKKKPEEKLEKILEEKVEKKPKDNIEDKKAEDKLVVEEKINIIVKEGPKRSVKLVYGEDIRSVQLPINCSILKLRETIHDRFPSSRAVLIKYRDQEGDLVTITTDDELKWAESSAEHPVRFYVVEVNPAQDPFFEKFKREGYIHTFDVKGNKTPENGNLSKGKESDTGPCCIDDWIIQFAQLFKNYVGFNSDGYLDLHELGSKLYSEAMEETVTSEEAQDLFNAAAEKFQEMTALSLFNWGNVHMSRARKRIYFIDDASGESVLTHVKTAYDWAQKEYKQAGRRYEEALKMKPDFYEGHLALGQQQFEQAKLTWYYEISCSVDPETWDCSEVVQMYNCAEDNMEKGMRMWEEAMERCLSEQSKPSKAKILLQNMGLDGVLKDISATETAEQVAKMKSQINLLWGTMLYERSIMEFKIGVPIWQECLEVAVEKFELAGASPTDIAVMMKNHCSNSTTLEGLGFNIDEIVQAWNEMYEAKKWQHDVPSFRLEPLLRRRVSKLYHALEHA